jgi:hypothetical protein
MGATSDWRIPAADFPAGASTKDKLGFAVKYAMLAPSVFGWPAWEYRLMDGFVQLFVRTSAMEQGEREIMIGCGASLQLFKLALKHLGCLGRIESFPDLASPELVAIVHAGGRSERDALDGQLFAAIREAGVPEAMTADVVDVDAAVAALLRAAEAERSWLEFAQTGSSRERLRLLAFPPPRLEVEEIGVQDAWLDERPPSRGAGFLFRRFSRREQPRLVVKVRASTSLDPGLAEPSGATESTGTFAVLKTRTDDKHGWVAAGLNLARMILQARVLGISCGLHIESLRAAHARAALRAEIGRKGFVQAILQFGFGYLARPIAPPSEQIGTRTSFGSPVDEST